MVSVRAPNLEHQISILQECQMVLYYAYIVKDYFYYLSGVAPIIRGTRPEQLIKHW